MSARGGRRAALPDAAWQPLERILADGTSVRFVEEATGEVRVYDCATIDAPPEIQRWLARVLARGTAARSGVKRGTSFGTYVAVLRLFVLSLGGAKSGVTRPGEVMPWHISAFADGYKGTKSFYGHMVVVRKFLRNDEELPARTRAALAAIEAAKPIASLADTEYTDAEWQQIMTALRRTVRSARDRIRTHREDLAHYRAGEPLERRERHIAMLADVFERTGDFPREPSGGYVWQLETYGGMAGAGHRMCLTPDEMAAFALLLTVMTGGNFGTVAGWPAAHFRPDGAVGDGPALALVEAGKPRRGPDREHMITPLEDLPPSLEELFSSADGEDRLFRSPLRLYLLLLELTATSRRHGAHTKAHSAYTVARRDGGSRWIEGPRSKHLARWAQRNGFPTEPKVVAGGPAPIDMTRIRRTVTELRRRPTAHTRGTMRDIYLMPSPSVQRESRFVVTAALEREVSKARARQKIPVLAREQLERAESDPGRAAAETGLEPAVLKLLAAGEQDTGVTACIDHLSGLHGPVGHPCPASFLDCLNCTNARALPHQLPVQILAVDQIAALRPHVEPQVWQIRYQPWLIQLEEIAAHYTKAERDRARREASARQHQLVEDLVEGRWDLR